MKIDMNINISHIARVEGHGDIHIKVKDGRLVEAKWSVVETPRFFEVMLKNKSIEMAPLIVSRICGICSVSHTLASLRAIENALSVAPPHIAEKLRLLALNAEILQSHSLHLFFLAMPDFYNEHSAIPLMKRKNEMYESALRIRGLANLMCELIGGRTTHPVSFCIGGIRKTPTTEEYLTLIESLSKIITDLEFASEIFESLQMPDFQRDTEFVSLKGENNYNLIGGSLVSSDGVKKNENDYLAMTNEYTVDFSTSKHARLSRDSFAAGPLARINNNYNFLHPAAKDEAEKFNLKPPNHNPFMNNIARLVECFHVVYDSILLLEEVIEDKSNDLISDFSISEAEGISAIEAPRGILYHHYEINKKGKIEKANCVIPTTQNNANIHLDLYALVKEELAKGKTDNEITRLSEMLVRSYDPCISCSVH
ncbi:MAG: Ni/Fe hydrogenase subunit alpha [Spirochaetia bacterium]|nr:Ni/Fe hydrogenase subunit alpha [Spirochaetia bacterium]